MWETTKEAGAKPGREQSRDLEIITITCVLEDAQEIGWISDCEEEEVL